MGTTKKKPAVVVDDDSPTTTTEAATAAEIVNALYERAEAEEASELVEIPQLGMTVCVKGMSATARARQLDRLAERPEGERRVSTFETYVRFWVECVYTPDGNTCVFDGEDFDDVAEKFADLPYGLVESVAFVAQRLSGQSPEAVDEAGKDS